MPSIETIERITSQAAASGEQQLAGFIKKCDSKNAALIRSVRKALRGRLPTANELVYDNYNSFVIRYCSATGMETFSGSKNGNLFSQ